MFIRPGQKLFLYEVNFLNFTPAALPPLAVRAPPKYPTPLLYGGWFQEEQIPRADHVQSQLMEGELKEGSINSYQCM